MKINFLIFLILIAIAFIAFLNLTVASAQPCSGIYTIPDISLKWNFDLKLPLRLQITGILINSGVHYINNAELVAQAVASDAAIVGSSRFRFPSEPVMPGTSRNFGMMIDLQKKVIIDHVVFNIYFDSEQEDQTGLPQFISFTGGFCENR